MQIKGKEILGMVKKRWTKNNQWKLLAIALLSMSLLIAIPTLAWFYYNRSMQSIAMIKIPDDLTIGEGDMKPSLEIDLGQIDVTEGTEKKIVFCVYSKLNKNYNLQLAHTTNIGFQYRIFKAQKNESGIIEDNNGEKYIMHEELSGTYINKDNNGIANDTYHNITYPKGDTNYQNVQDNAEPLYWKTSESIGFPATPNKNGYYVNYYILKIRWDGLNLTNNKETDMVYLMAESAASTN